MRAYIKLWGNKYAVESISWYKGEISHVSFADENDIFRTIHGKKFGYELDAETNRYSGQPIFADLEKNVFWTKK